MGCVEDHKIYSFKKKTIHYGEYNSVTLKSGKASDKDRMLCKNKNGQRHAGDDAAQQIIAFLQPQKMHDKVDKNLHLSSNRVWQIPRWQANWELYPHWRTWIRTEPGIRVDYVDQCVSQIGSDGPPWLWIFRSMQPWHIRGGGVLTQQNLTGRRDHQVLHFSTESVTWG